MFLKSQCDPPALRRLLANRPPVQANVAALDRDEAGDRAQQRGLACARWPTTASVRPSPISSETSRSTALAPSRTATASAVSVDKDLLHVDDLRDQPPVDFVDVDAQDEPFLMSASVAYWSCS